MAFPNDEVGLPMADDDHKVHGATPMSLEAPEEGYQLGFNIKVKPMLHRRTATTWGSLFARGLRRIRTARLSLPTIQEYMEIDFSLPLSAT